jgi:acyl-CoA synthetase (AMP-forming)/AMP-acid ligase II
MDTSTDPQAYVAAVLGRLTGPGGDFEITTQDVLGAPTQMMRNDGRSLAQLVTDSTRYGERDYLVTEDRRVSFAEHFAAVRSLAHALHEQYGVGPGDRVAILAANSVEWVESFWAVEFLGAVSVGFNSWWSAPEGHHRRRQAG